jgi:hypothetical protein
MVIGGWREPAFHVRRALPQLRVEMGSDDDVGAAPPLTWHRPQRLACGRAKHAHGQPQEGRLRLSAPRCLQSLSNLPIILLSAHSSNNTHTPAHYHSHRNSHSLSPEPPFWTAQVTSIEPLYHLRLRLEHHKRSRDASCIDLRRIQSSLRPRDRPPRLSHFLLYHHTSHGQSSTSFNG